MSNLAIAASQRRARERTVSTSSKFAQKNKTTGDWFSYSNTVSESTIHDIFNGASKLQSDEARVIRNKISGGGQEGKWFKHDDNRNYRDPIKNRLPSADARNIKEKHENSFSRLSPDDERIRFMRSGAHREEVAKNYGKIRGGHETPQWFVHPDNETPRTFNSSGDETDRSHVKTRLTTDEALYYRDRNKLGNSEMWAGEEEEEDEEELQRVAEGNWRPETRAGRNPKAESEVWFHHEEHNPGRSSSTMRQYSSQTVRDTVEKARGMEMLKIFQQMPTSNDTNLKLVGVNRRKPGGEQANSSTMQYVLDQNQNQYYKEPIRPPRAVKFEGMEIFKKSKDGIMSQCLSGYPDQAYRKEIHKMPNSDQEQLKKHSGSDMARALVGALPPTGRNSAARAVKPEAEKNAERNRGSMKDIFTTVDNTRNSNGYAHAVNFPDNMKLRSDEARQIARKYHGSVNNLIF